MSSIPTSLIVVLLVAAWLVVLVPMFARRREAVPESDDEATGFRVLRRATRRVRRRARSGDEPSEVPESETTAGAEPERQALEVGHVPGAVGARKDRDSVDGAQVDAAQVELGAVDPDIVVAPVEAPVDAADEWRSEQARPRPVGQARSVRGAKPADPRTVRGRPSGARVVTNRALPDPVGDDDLSDPPRRPGRGGFDPEAAEATRKYRYRTRRRVLLILAVITIAFVVPAYLMSPVFWIGTAAGGLLLAAYLMYLRRQVRIEEEVRHRRMARLRRARQIRPEHPASDAHPVAASPYGAASSRAASAVDFVEESFAQPQTVPPAERRTGRVVLDLDDDDPSFDELETYHRPTYRRQAG